MAPGGPDGRGAWRPRRRTDHGGLAGPQVLDRRRLSGWDAERLATGRGGARGAKAFLLVTEVLSGW